MYFLYTYLFLKLIIKISKGKEELDDLLPKKCHLGRKKSILKWEEKINITKPSKFPTLKLKFYEREISGLYNCIVFITVKCFILI